MPKESWSDAELKDNKFEMPIGFIPPFEERYKTVSGYDEGMEKPQPGTFSQNNGTIAIVTSEGKIGIWIPKDDPNAPRTLPYNRAIDLIKSMGYKEARNQFYVPDSNYQGQ